MFYFKPNNLVLSSQSHPQMHSADNTQLKTSEIRSVNVYCFQKSLIEPVKSALDYYQNMAKTTDEERKRREERKLSSGTPPRKLSTENTEQLSDSRTKGAAERKKSPASKKSVGNGPLDQNVTRKSSTGCNASERKISKEHVSNGPIIVGK